MLANAIKLGLIWLFSIFSSYTANANCIDQVKIMSFNIENGGEQVNFNKILEVIRTAEPDVVGIQESMGNLQKIATSLGWENIDPTQHIISQHKLYQPSSKSKFSYVELCNGKFIAIANVHLPDNYYGPEMAQKGTDVNQIILHEKTVRLKKIQNTIDELSILARKGMPVFFIGDFNSPSHLDWNKQSRSKNKIQWPISKYFVKKGFADSYRAANPDVNSMPGYTWPAARPNITNSQDGYNPSSSDIPDRIDFIYVAGPTKILSSFIIGEASSNYTDIKITPWPSDHRAVISRFKVKAASVNSSSLLHTQSQFPRNQSALIKTNKDIIGIGEPIQIYWDNAPGHQFDYISISKLDDKRPLKAIIDESVRLYLHGQKNGNIAYFNENVRGNFLHWSETSSATWPLAPGTYNIKLMMDDSYIELASTKIIVKDNLRMIYFNE